MKNVFIISKKITSRQNCLTKIKLIFQEKMADFLNLYSQ